MTTSQIQFFNEQNFDPKIKRNPNSNENNKKKYKLAAINEKRFENNNENLSIINEADSENNLETDMDSDWENPAEKVKNQMIV